MIKEGQIEQAVVMINEFYGCRNRIKNELVKLAIETEYQSIANTYNHLFKSN